ncbi:hypothetical protein MHYP_G00297510 [Metynnis hypsauchen]
MSRRLEIRLNSAAKEEVSRTLEQSLSPPLHSCPIIMTAKQPEGQLYCPQGIVGSPFIDMPDYHSYWSELTTSWEGHKNI